MSAHSKKVQPKFGLVRLTFHSEDRGLTDGYLRSWGQDPREFTEELKTLERDAEKLDKIAAELKPGEKLHVDGVTRTKKFTSVEVHSALEEIRARKLVRAGLDQVRRNRFDTGGQVFGQHGVSNAVMPTLVTALVTAGFALVEIERVRAPATYSRANESRAKREIEKLFKKYAEKALLGQLTVEGTLTGENLQEKLEPLLSDAERLQLAYLRSIEEGKLKKTHPTEAKPYGSVQVWKYMAAVVLLLTEEDTGKELATDFEKKVMKTSYWQHFHAWMNPDGSLTLNFISPDGEDGPPRTLTVIGYSPDRGEITAKVVINKKHPEYNPEDEELLEDLRKRVRKEQDRLDRAMQADEAGDRHDAQLMSRRPEKGHRLGDLLQSKIDGKNGDTPPPASN